MPIFFSILIDHEVIMRPEGMHALSFVRDAVRGFSTRGFGSKDYATLDI